MMDFFFFQAEDGIRDLVRSRGLGDVYKRQAEAGVARAALIVGAGYALNGEMTQKDLEAARFWLCLLYTSDAADDLLCVDLGGRRIIQKKTTRDHSNKHGP